MGEKKTGNRVTGGVLLFGLALAAILAAVGYRALDGVDADTDESPAATPLEALEARVVEEPGDAAAWQELGFTRYGRGEFGAAATAYREATALEPDTAVLWSAYGEALVMDSQRDPLPSEALAAFRRAIALDPADPRARYFLAVKRDLDGDHEGAISAWLELLEDTPPGAPWEADLARTIEQVATINKLEVAPRLERAQAARSVPAATGAIPGPNAAQLAAASQMPPGEQRQMAEGMVASLEQKLVADPSNLDGWVMLMRSRTTLGQPDRARKALSDAVAANPSAATRLRAEAEALGIR
jgi:cytochrome c-type biogenesis protein CcmH